MPISLNGMGLREAGYVVLFARLGIAAGDAVTFSLLLFAASAFDESRRGGVYLFMGTISAALTGTARTEKTQRLSSVPAPTGCCCNLCTLRCVVRWWARGWGVC